MRFFINIICALCLTVLPITAHAREIPFSQPVDSVISKAINLPEEPWLSGHRGVDYNVTAGYKIHAMRMGQISFAGFVVDTTWVTIDHGGGLSTTYGPIEIAPDLMKGSQVSAGDVIGVVPEGADILNVGARIPHPKYKKKYLYIDPNFLQYAWKIRLKVVP